MAISCNKIINQSLKNLGMILKIDANEYIPPNFSAMVMAALDLLR
jgi:hypothetical protein